MSQNLAKQIANKFFPSNLTNSQIIVNNKVKNSHNNNNVDNSTPDLLFVEQTNLFDSNILPDPFRAIEFASNKTNVMDEKISFITQKNSQTATDNQEYYRPHKVIASFALPAAPNYDTNRSQLFVDDFSLYKMRANFASGIEY